MVVIPNPTGLKTQPITTLGTKQLLFLQVDMQTDVATDYLNHDSLYNRAIRGMQTACEVSGVGIPKGELFTALVPLWMCCRCLSLSAFDTAPIDGRHAEDHFRIADIEKAINDATGLTNVRVSNGLLAGWDIEIGI
jgi:hypothetical protein